MSSAIDLEAQQVAQVVPRASAFFPLITVGVVTAHKEGAETHTIDILGAHTSSVASPLQSVSTGQNINDEAHPVVPQGVISIWPCCRSPSRLFCFVTGSRVESGPTEMKITSDQPTQAEVQIRACFLKIVAISMT